MSNTGSYYKIWRLRDEPELVAEGYLADVLWDLGWTNKCSLYTLISDIRRGCRRRYLICVNGEFVRPEYPVPEAYARELAVAIDRVGPQDKEYRPPERTYPQLAKTWDDFCEPIRRRYGIPVWRGGGNGTRKVHPVPVLEADE